MADSLSALRQRIPSHCFEKNAILSTYYLVRDLGFLFALYLLKDALFFANTSWLGYVLWVNVVGFFGWALFVVGHDCGHGSFSDHYWYNEICGHIAHTPLLVPFTGWKISHRLHHTHHNHVTKDHGWKPALESDIKGIGLFSYYIRHSVLAMFMYYYYLFGVPDSPTFLSGSHYYPFSRLFRSSQVVPATVSTLSVVFWLGFLFSQFSVATLVLYYFVPLLIFSCWLSVVTYLHHTHKDASVYDDGEWTYYKGAVMTVDRDFGSMINHLHHNIETHVIHHLFFTSIPHYHLKDATDAIKGDLGSDYFFDPTPISMSLCKALKECSYIKEHEKGVYHFNGYDPEKMDRRVVKPNGSGNNSSKEVPSSAAKPRVAAPKKNASYSFTHTLYGYWLLLRGLWVSRA